MTEHEHDYTDISATVNDLYVSAEPLDMETAYKQMQSILSQTGLLVYDGTDPNHPTKREDIAQDMAKIIMSAAGVFKSIGKPMEWYFERETGRASKGLSTCTEC